MRIAVIGTGNVGAALARGLSRTRHQVTLGVREPGDPRVRRLAEENGAALATPAEAVAMAEIVILALPWAASEEAVRGLGSLAGKIVIDCMNPIGTVGGTLGLTLGHTTSGGEAVAGWLPGARVVKTLNQCGAETMADARALPHAPVMFMAGDDPDAKAAVGALLADLGFEPLDAGSLDKARLLEPFGMVWINQAMARGKGRAWAFAAVDRP